LGVALNYVLSRGMPPMVGKLLTKVTNLLSTSPTQEIIGIQNGGSSNFGNFKTPNLGISRKMTFGCNPYGESQKIL